VATDLKSKDSFQSAYDNLNPAQKQAVNTIEGPVIVLAGPGTGKTQILALRIANILRHEDSQVRPSNILCLTFTESGVSAMRNRLLEFIGNQAYYVGIFTFHSFCNDVIKSNPDKFSHINAISDLEKIHLFEQIIDELEPDSSIKPFGDPHFYRKDLMRLVQNFKRESIKPEDIESLIDSCEKFIESNQNLLDEFVHIHGKTIKESHCADFLSALKAGPGDALIKLFEDNCKQSIKPNDFKNFVKDFYEDQIKNIPRQKELVKVYQRYQEKLKSLKLYDFEDMILRVIKQFENDRELLAEYQEKFQYILVDEYQDTNGSQNRILELLTAFYGSNSNIFVVGDDDQAIYRFQGASVENIIYFYNKYQEHLTSIVLETNYRSTQQILDLSYKLIEYNSSRISKIVKITKKLFAAKSDSQLSPVEINSCQDKTTELYAITNRIKELTNQIPSNQIAVLVRENKNILEVKRALELMRIPCQAHLSSNIFDDIYISQFLDLLKVISNLASNQYLLFNLLNYSFVFESKEFRDKNISYLDIYRTQSKYRSNKSEETITEYLLREPLFSEFIAKIIEFNQKAVNYRVVDLVEQIAKEFGYLQFILKQKSRIEAIANLEALFREIEKLSSNSNVIFKTFDSSHIKELKLGDFIKYIELLDNNDLSIEASKIYANINAVNIMTAHKSKGLEFEHVFVYDCNDKLWGNNSKKQNIKLPPNLQVSEAIKSVDLNEDERRLFYVALTRAKDQAYIYYRLKKDDGKDDVPSIFVTELLSAENHLLHHNQIKINQEDIVEFSLKRFETKTDDSLDLEKAFIDSLLEHYQLSVTHLNNFIACPRKFFYQNLLRVPAAKNLHGCLGSAVHGALFDHFSKKQSQNKELAIKVALDNFEERLRRDRLTESEFALVSSNGRRIIQEYFDRYFDTFSYDNLLEYDFSNKGVNFEGTKLTGKLDKIEIKSETQVRVIDYKTGKAAKGKSKAKFGGDYHRQIVFYQLLCDLAKANSSFKYRMIEGEIDFLEPEQDKFVRVPIAVSEQDLDLLKLEIRSMMSRVKDHDFAMTTDTQHCEQCQFKNICGR
jgi:DNA helicase-2/ATP-dependent DNA helicase PcrA